jgi:16S rRNA (cytosine1402-N4)-methyltransferase
MHTPVLLEEVLQYLAIQPQGRYLDATAGLGGHTRAIAERLTTGQVIAADRDAESLQLARQVLGDQGDKIRYLQARFAELGEKLAGQSFHGILADLGVSRYQLTEGERGFSVAAEGPLDMRMDRSQPETAADLVNHLAEEALAQLIYQLGEERRSRKIARAIVRARPIRTTAELARVIEAAVPRTGRLHPATKTFMALRLAVNRELEELRALLELAPQMLAPGGRLVVISFHSLEDRMVKHRFQELARAGRARLLTKHVVKPTREEIARNPPSRSARLRALEIVDRAL